MRGALNAIRVAQSRKGDIVEAYSHFVRLFAGIGEFSILPYTEDAEHIYKAFPPHIKRIGTNDCRIAATAQAHGCVLITVNVTDFRQIEGLQVEDWTEGIQQ
jgi:tRNA(fMet)-specific endonuclease VapC